MASNTITREERSVRLDERELPCLHRDSYKEDLSFRIHKQTLYLFIWGRKITNKVLKVFELTGIYGNIRDPNEIISYLDGLLAALCAEFMTKKIVDFYVNTLNEQKVSGQLNYLVNLLKQIKLENDTLNVLNKSVTNFAISNIVSSIDKWSTAVKELDDLGAVIPSSFDIRMLLLPFLEKVGFRVISEPLDEEWIN